MYWETETEDLSLDSAEVVAGGVNSSPIQILQITFSILEFAGLLELAKLSITDFLHLNYDDPIHRLVTGRSRQASTVLIEGTLVLR